MQINKSYIKPIQTENIKKDVEKNRKDLVEKENEKTDRVEIASTYPLKEKQEIKEENLSGELYSDEKNYIQMKYLGYKIKENPEEALGIYAGLSKERVSGLI